MENLFCFFTLVESRTNIIRDWVPVHLACVDALRSASRKDSISFGARMFDGEHGMPYCGLFLQILFSYDRRKVEGPSAHFVALC